LALAEEYTLFSSSKFTFTQKKLRYRGRLLRRIEDALTLDRAENNSNNLVGYAEVRREWRQTCLQWPQKPS
jgi:hypothetical protein